MLLAAGGAVAASSPCPGRYVVREERRADAHGDKAVRFMAATSEKSADTFLVRVKTKDDRASLLAVLAPEKATA